VTDKLHCPTCGVHIDEHEATRCMDWWIECRLFGASFVPKNTEIPVPTVSAIGVYRLSNETARTAYDCYRLAGGKYVQGTIPRKRYSSNIADAWDVVEKTKLFIGYSFCQSWNGSRYLVTYFVRDDDECYHETYASAPTAPLAICRAAIKAVNT
jgi:hypothetical protein